MPARLFRLCLILSLAAAASGCTVGADFRPPIAQTPSAWSASAAPATSGQASVVTPAPLDHSDAWWAKLDDPELTSLITRAAAANLDAREAVARIVQARAQRDITGAAAWPSLTANASSQVNRLSESTPTGGLFSRLGAFPGLSGISIPNPYDQHQLGFDASWEIDLFGRVRRSLEAAKADVQASVEDSRSVLISTLAEVGRTYVDLRGAQAKRRIVAENLATARDLLDLAGQRRRAGLSSDIDMDRAQAEAEVAEAALPSLDNEISQDINALSKLVAREPGALRTELDVAKPPPPVPPTVPIGLPADLARRRPDIREAEARLHAATARVGVAESALYPSLSLNVAGGYQTQELSTLTNWASRFLTAGPTLGLPIFEGGRLRATVRLQDAAEKVAALDYRRAVLGALHEADNALAAYRYDQARKAALGEALVRNRDAADLARQRYASGVGSFIDVLNAERARQQSELSLTDSATAVSVDLIALYKALGGGWS